MCFFEVDEGRAAFSVHETLAGIHRLCRGGEQDSYRLLSGLSQPQ